MPRIFILRQHIICSCVILCVCTLSTSYSYHVFHFSLPLCFRHLFIQIDLCIANDHQLHQNSWCLSSFYSSSYLISSRAGHGQQTPFCSASQLLALCLHSRTESQCHFNLRTQDCPFLTITGVWRRSSFGAMVQLSIRSDGHLSMLPYCLEHLLGSEWV